MYNPSVGWAMIRICEYLIDPEPRIRKFYLIPIQEANELGV